MAILKERLRHAPEASESEPRATVIDALEAMQTRAVTPASERRRAGAIEATLGSLQRGVEKGP